jgi:hypothetical protein
LEFLPGEVEVFQIDVFGKILGVELAKNVGSFLVVSTGLCTDLPNWAALRLRRLSAFGFRS